MTDDERKSNLLNALNTFEEAVDELPGFRHGRTSAPVNPAVFDPEVLVLPAASPPEFFVVPLLDLAGLGVEDAKSNTYDTFYEREDVTELWTLIDNLQKKKVLSIQGQPGTGQSSALWRKVLEMAVSGDNILWISLDRDGGPVSIVYFQGTCYAEFQMKLRTVQELEIFMHHKSIPLDTVVVDGCSEKKVDLTTEIRLWVIHSGTNPKCRAIFTSSTKVERLRSHQNDHVTYHIVHSWKRKQFKAALFTKNDTTSPILDACAELFCCDHRLYGNHDDDDEGEDDDDDEDADKGDEQAFNTSSEVGSDTRDSAAITDGSLTEETKVSPTAALPSGHVETDYPSGDAETDEGASRDNSCPPPAKKLKALSAEDVEEMIRSRYDYSGGSARWMFNYTKSQIETALRSYCDSAENRQSILNGAIGPTSKAATNYFFGSSKKSDGHPEYFLVSKRAVEIIAEKTTGSSFEALYRFADRLQNPSFVGWVVEADFFYQVNKARTESAEFCPLKLTEGGAAFKPEAIHDWEHTRNKNCLLTLDSATVRAKTKKAAQERVSKIASRLITKNNGSSIVGKPVAWNQGGYDAFFVERVSDKSICLRFVQITKGVSHDLKAEYMSCVTKFFEKADYTVESVEIAFILTPKNSSSFALGEVTGEEFLTAYHLYGAKDGTAKWSGAEDVACYELSISTK